MDKRMKLELYGPGDSHLFTITSDDYNEWIQGWDNPAEDWPMCEYIDIYIDNAKVETLNLESREDIVKTVKRLSRLIRTTEEGGVNE